MKLWAGNPPLKDGPGKKPPLFQRDYVHFTYQGADTISKLLFQAIFAIPGIPAKDTLLALQPVPVGA